MVHDEPSLGTRALNWVKTGANRLVGDMVIDTVGGGANVVAEGALSITGLDTGEDQFSKKLTATARRNKWDPNSYRAKRMKATTTVPLLSENFLNGYTGLGVLGLGAVGAGLYKLYSREPQPEE